MILSFELSMPGRSSWEGRWSGEVRDYIKVVNLGRGKETAAKAQRVLEKGYFTFPFSDGWRAGVKVKLVDAREAAKLRKRSAGFCGYDWMVRSILAHNEIRDGS